MPDHLLPHNLRPFNPSTDMNFIASNFIYAFSQGLVRDDPRSRPAPKVYPPKYQLQAYQALLEKLLAIGTCTVAVSKTEPDQIYGFAISGPSKEAKPVLFWIGVKVDYRQQGIGSSLRWNVSPSALSVPWVTPQLLHLLDKWQLMPDKNWSPIRLSVSRLKE